MRAQHQETPVARRHRGAAPWPPTKGRPDGPRRGLVREHDTEGGQSGNGPAELSAASVLATWEMHRQGCLGPLVLSRTSSSVPLPKARSCQSKHSRGHPARPGMALAWSPRSRKRLYFSACCQGWPYLEFVCTWTARSLAARGLVMRTYLQHAMGSRDTPTGCRMAAWSKPTRPLANPHVAAAAHQRTAAKAAEGKAHLLSRQAQQIPHQTLRQPATKTASLLIARRRTCTAMRVEIPQVRGGGR
mmetsp:Transcript_36488/g.117058  ORF Transcript_36488/g.117058 Transcript_36488/m.117058 type:complete len:245 (+) Transcript_36488:1917-2651(+)